MHRAVVQSGFPSNPDDAGSVQAGVARTGTQVGFDMCGATNGAYREYTEEHATFSGTTGYVCQYYATTQPGNNHLYDAARDAAASTWSLQIDSATVGSYNLGFNTAYPMAGGEINGFNTTYTSHTAAQYGNTNQWGIYRAAGRQLVRGVTSGDSTALLGGLDGGSWTVPLPPTPFAISR